MSHPRGLSEEEAALWEKVAATVVPLHPVPPPPANEGQLNGNGGVASAKSKPAGTPMSAPMPRMARHVSVAPPEPLPRSSRRVPSPGNLDSHWDRRLKSGEITPDLALDLHDHGMDAAYGRLMGGMEQARSMGARVVLVVTGRPRPVDSADRATSRGVIRAKILDWLAASEHGEAIAAIRQSHRRHGGDGALYVVLRRSR